MNRPAPQVGQIVRFDYLWRDEARAGQQQDSKDRPCAVVVARKTEHEGLEIVLLAPITHSPPMPGTNAIAIPARAGRLTGLDDDQSWLIVSEVNLVDWSDPGFVPADRNNWLCGHLPRFVAQQAIAALRSHLAAGSMAVMKR